MSATPSSFMNKGKVRLSISICCQNRYEIVVRCAQTWPRVMLRRGMVIFNKAILSPCFLELKVLWGFPYAQVIVIKIRICFIVRKLCNSLRQLRICFGDWLTKQASGWHTLAAYLKVYTRLVFYKINRMSTFWRLNTSKRKNTNTAPFVQSSPSNKSPYHV